MFLSLNTRCNVFLHLAFFVYVPAHFWLRDFNTDSDGFLGWAILTRCN